MFLNRVLTLYEFFKMTRKQLDTLQKLEFIKVLDQYFLQILKIFQSESLTQVHGFDWFNGASLVKMIQN